MRDISYLDMQSLFSWQKKENLPQQFKFIRPSELQILCLQGSGKKPRRRTHHAGLYLNFRTLIGRMITSMASFIMLWKTTRQIYTWIFFYIWTLEHQCFFCNWTLFFLKAPRSTGESCKISGTHVDRTQRRRDCPSSLGTHHTAALTPLHTHTHTPPTHATVPSGKSCAERRSNPGPVASTPGVPTARANARFLFPHFPCVFIYVHRTLH